MKFILGLKIGMSKVFDEKGIPVPVTLVEAGPCEITQIKTKEKDGYKAVQIGFLKLKDKKIKKSQKNKAFKHLREFQANISDYKVGQKIDVSNFEEVKLIKISGISKGKGFAGGVKRWGFRGQPKSRGAKGFLRSIGSIGASSPSRVIKGKKMPGRMGFDRITVKNLKIIKIDKKNNALFIRGAIPGRKGTLLEIRG
ncbi:MAG: 50S ribosomal protein L3 [Patescibacteria group bacterium]|nr:50S ribosomal protein L3 [Patescibacteria group bacterium]